MIDPVAFILVMGVSGSGKTTIGRLLAERLGGAFVDADDLHPIANIQKMERGQALDDDDRWPWLSAVAHAAESHTGPSPLVLACSALKAIYRERLRLGNSPIVFLTGSREILEQRLASRRKHFMSARLLDSQLESLEEPGQAIMVSIAGRPATIVDEIVQALQA